MATKATEFKVATLNLFNNEHGRWSDREPLIHEQAVALDADIITLQEVDTRTDQVDKLVSALGPPHHATVLDNPEPSSIKSLAIISRLELTANDSCTDLGAGDVAERVRLRVGHDAVIEVATTHLHFGPSRTGSETRAAQVRKLLSWLGPVDGRPLVLTGDFNATPAGDTIKTIKRCLRSAHEVANGTEPEWTHPTPFVHAIDAQAAFGVPILPEGKGHAIDYVFVSPAIDVLQCRTCFDRPASDDPELYPSDHVGLVATLSMR